MQALSLIHICGSRCIVNCRSMRSINGPEMRLRYRAITSGLQRHRPEASPAQPHGHGFIAATNWKRAGKSHCRAARDTVTVPDSSGWRSTSSAVRLHSGWKVLEI